MPPYNQQQIGLPPFTPIVKRLIIINFIVWIIQSFMGAHVTFWMEKNFALHSLYSDFFKPWQIFTYMFMHSEFGSQLGIWHIVFNMLGLWMFGSALEIRFGARRFLIFYLLSGIGAAIIYLAYLHMHLHSYVQEFNLLVNQNIKNNLVLEDYARINEAMIGASGAVFGVLAGFAYLFPNTYLLVYFIIPLKAKWAMLGALAYELIATIHPFEGDNVGHVAHLGGALTGFLIIYFWFRKDRRHFY